MRVISTLVDIGRASLLHETPQQRVARHKQQELTNERRGLALDVMEGRHLAEGYEFPTQRAPSPAPVSR